MAVIKEVNGVRSVTFNEAETRLHVLSVTEKFVLIWLAVLLGVGAIIF